VRVSVSKIPSSKIPTRSGSALLLLQIFYSNAIYFIPPLAPRASRIGYFIALFMQPKVNYVFCFCSRRGIEVEVEVGSATEERRGTWPGKGFLHWGKNIAKHGRLG